MKNLYKSTWRSYVVFLLIIFASLQTVAQSDYSKFLPNIVPPSPTAGELGKYGNVPVGLFTGAANVSIPLFSFKTKDLESPLSLFYGSNGIKVDEVSSNVGLGWNLNFGGVITRTVRDKPDDAQLRVYPPDNLAGATQAEKVQFYNAAGQDNADTESDIYSFNFSGNSGKFTYDRNGLPFLITNQKIKIEKTGTGNADFLLTATDGIKYYFTEKESTTFRTSGAGHSVPNGGVTAWYLGKIVHQNGSQITFTYEEYIMDYVASNSQTLSMSYFTQLACSGVTYAKLPTLSGIMSQDMTVIGKRVTRISSNNTTDGYVTFTYYASGINEDIDGNRKIDNITLFTAENTVVEKIKFDYLKTANQRVFLQNITFLDPTKKYSFEYTGQTEFPQRLSYSQDHWGYYNGKYNTNLVDKNISQYGSGLDDFDYKGADKEPNADFAKIGLLKKIIYPTKGYTEFEYEANTYWGQKTIYPTKTRIRFERGTEDNDDIAIGKSFTSPTDQRIEFTGYVNYESPLGPPRYDNNGNLIPDPYDTGHYLAYVQISNRNSPNDFLSLYTYTYNGDKINTTSFRYTQKLTNTFYFDAKAGKTYDFFLGKGGLNASASVEVSYYATAPTIINTNIETGGVRIKSTKDFPIATAAPVYKRYYYANKDDINHSSGNTGRKPFYMDLSVQRQSCPTECHYADLFDLNISSSSMMSLFDTGSSNCFYKYVTVSEGGDAFENGGEMKEFTIHRDNWVDDFDSSGNPVTVDHEINGISRILGTLDIKSAPFTNFGWNNGLEIKSQVFQKKLAGSPFVIVAETENKYKLDPSYTKEIKSYAVRKNYTEICVNPNVVENLTIVEYKTKGYWFYVESSITRSYDLKGLNPVETTTTYQYNNPTHIQLTSQSTKSSSKETLETKYYYPQDAVMASEPQVSEMITTNRIDTPLKTEVFRAGIKQSEQKTEYAKDATTSNLLLPKFIYAAKFPNILPGNALEKKITYDKYDDVGNILQYTLESGMPVAIIWGYNKTKPIAKVENATYDQALAAYAANDTTFRTNLPSALITTYSYKPLVGITTLTDPKGFVTTYDYDTYNRLKTVKDNLGNVLSENQYHYKN
ncbi:hypothetical protein D0809_24240 [Flavobacterium circumlabens]|uniref:YD repeat-containing protein n=1 Tax=Flavobacterium circumlabens TaxID=2133765 RepID=A0A4Y7U5G8_9FLAO|nr:hypothetical protein [Flavobacterium circumlabens]TCN49640.1 YD repeat-containing protein [Flavobacterium circumlabens]TEB41683.1 hypothetical protein D0809_24240 [Flavobacterium circumlabens]